MELLTYVLLGMVQGLTEFLPVSSSGHLVLLQHWLGMNPSGAVTEVALHVATLVSVVVVYRRDIRTIFAKGDWRYLGLIGLGTVVTVVIALPAKDHIEALTDADYAVRLVGLMLMITAVWLVLADRRLKRGAPPLTLSWLSAALVGIAQAIAVMPGISRSGATIGAAVQLGSEREQAAKFSFLLSVPVILGAGVLKARDLPAAIDSGEINALGLGLAFIAALVFGILAIYLVLWLLKRARLTYFAVYCALLGIAALVIG
ncbi:undecaprenyl-diphosphate phosphatase [bacterium]|nr:undecaprenyl-diphosphate phosphatase [bacterium]